MARLDGKVVFITGAAHPATREDLSETASLVEKHGGRRSVPRTRAITVQ